MPKGSMSAGCTPAEAHWNRTACANCHCDEPCSAHWQRQQHSTQCFAAGCWQRAGATSRGIAQAQSRVLTAAPRLPWILHPTVLVAHPALSILTLPCRSGASTCPSTSSPTPPLPPMFSSCMTLLATPSRQALRGTARYRLLMCAVLCGTASDWHRLPPAAATPAACRYTCFVPSPTPPHRRPLTAPSSPLPSPLPAAAGHCLHHGSHGALPAPLRLPGLPAGTGLPLCRPRVHRWAGQALVVALACPLLMAGWMEGCGSPALGRAPACTCPPTRHAEWVRLLSPQLCPTVPRPSAPYPL